MRNYEVAFIAHPETSDQALSALTERIQGWVTAGGGSVVKTDTWGKRRFAYPIRKQREGHYVFLYAQMPPALGAELERQFRITEEVMRFLITQGEPPPAPPAPVAPPAPQAAEAPRSAMAVSAPEPPPELAAPEPPSPMEEPPAETAEAAA